MFTAKCNPKGKDEISAVEPIEAVEMDHNVQSDAASLCNYAHKRLRSYLSNDGNVGHEEAICPTCMAEMEQIKRSLHRGRYKYCCYKVGWVDVES